MFTRLDSNDVLELTVEVDVVATGNVSPLQGCPVVDGIQTRPGFTVLLPHQAVDSENGPWIVRHADWQRPVTAYRADVGATNAEVGYVETADTAPPTA